MSLIHELLALERPLIILDFETTGLDVDTARIIELGFELYTAEGLKKTYRQLINPGVLIPPQATAAHHITDEDVLNKPKFKQLAANLASGFSHCDFAGKNVRYDLRVCAREMRRNGVEWSYEGAHIIDIDRLEQIGEPRTLSHLYKKHTGEDLDNAHQAMADVRASTVVICKQLETYTEALPRNVKMLHDLQWPGWIDTEGKFKFDEEGTPRVMFGKHRNVPMKNVPPSYWRWILEADFPKEVKQLASDAIVYKFPTRGAVDKVLNT